MTRKEMNNKMNKDTTEYEKNLNELKEQILKEGNTLLTKRDLLERFCEIDKEYKGRPWNLLQILANINILIEQQPCEDAISRQAVIEAFQMFREYESNLNNKEWVDRIENIVNQLPPVQPKPKTVCSCNQIKWERDMAIAQLNELGYGLGEKPKTAHWILLDECSNSGYYCSNCHKKVVKEGWSNTVKKIKFCPNCGSYIVGD